MGNPYPYKVLLDRAFYSLNADGTWQAHPYGDSLAVGQVALVHCSSAETTLNPKEAEMAVYQLEKVVSRLLLDGHTVQLGDLGTFNITITAEGQKEEKKVSADDIKKVNLRFRISKTMREAVYAEVYVLYMLGYMFCICWGICFVYAGYMLGIC